MSVDITPYLNLQFWLARNDVVSFDESENEVSADSTLTVSVRLWCCRPCKTSWKAHRCGNTEKSLMVVWAKATGFNEKVISTIVENAASRVEKAHEEALAEAPDPVPNFPAHLKQLDSWGVWKKEQVRDEKTGEFLFNEDGSPRMAKVPYNARTHWKGNPSFEGSGSSFVDACKALKTEHGYLGVCFGFFYKDGLTSIDIDDCRNAETGAIVPWGMDIVREVNSYTEISPSGTGLHIVAKGWQVPWDGTEDGRQGRRCGIEMYSGKHYFTVTGNHLEDTPATVEVRDLTNIFKKLEGRVYQKLAKSGQKDSSAESEAEIKSTNYNTLVYGGKTITTKRTLLMTGDFVEGAKPFRITDEWDNYVEYSSQSEADAALVLSIAMEVSRDKAVIREEFQESTLYRDKAERDVLSERFLNEVIKLAEEKASFKTPAAQVVLDEIPEDPTATWEPDFAKDFEIDYAQTSMRDLTIRLYGKYIVYAVIVEKGVWMRFNGRHWVEVGNSVIRDLIRKASYHIRDKMIPTLQGDPEDVQKKRERYRTLIAQCHDVTFINKVMTWMTGRQISCSEFDQKPMLLNFMNGTYDFATKEFRKFDSADFLRQIMPVNYNPKAKCPVFRKMLSNAFDNPEMPPFIIRYMGYSMLGVATEKCFVLLHGQKDNGKTTLLEIWAAILGSYAKNCEWETFSSLRAGTIRNDIADLSGARFVYCDEGERDIKLAEGKVKQFSGDGTMKARFLNKEHFQFPITFKMVMSTNVRPIMSGDDPALKERVKDVWMRKTFSKGSPERIPNLKAKLWEEREGIAALMVEGALEFLRNQEENGDGLRAPEEVKMNTDDYFKEQNPVQQFIEEHCTQGEKLSVGRVEFHTAYNSWAGEYGKETLGDRFLADRLDVMGFKEKKSHNPRGWAGLALLKNAPGATV